MNHLLKNELESIKRDGTSASPLGDCKNAFVACNDMAEAAVTCFREGPERHGDVLRRRRALRESTPMSDVSLS